MEQKEQMPGGGGNQHQASARTSGASSTPTLGIIPNFLRFVKRRPRGWYWQWKQRDLSEWYDEPDDSFAELIRQQEEWMALMADNVPAPEELMGVTYEPDLGWRPF
jgi:hypothetical protein